MNVLRKKIPARLAVPVGAGLELSAHDVTANPSGWKGDIAVDVNDSERTITVSADGQSGDFEISDDLVNEGTPAMLNVGVIDGEITLSRDVAHERDDPEAPGPWLLLNRTLRSRKH